MLLIQALQSRAKVRADISHSLTHGDIFILQTLPSFPLLGSEP